MKYNSRELTPKQNNFCYYYLQTYNATKAYKMAYHVKYTTAECDGYRLIRNDKIKKRIVSIRHSQSRQLYCDRLDVIRRLLEMFFANIGDYVRFGHKLSKDDFGRTYQRSYLYFKNQENVDTRLIQSITRGQNGNRVELPDKIRLASLLLKYLPRPSNSNPKSDTLIEALIKGLKDRD